MHEYAEPYLHPIQVKNDLTIGIMKSSFSGARLVRLNIQFQFQSGGRSFKLFLINTEFSLCINT